MRFFLALFVVFFIFGCSIKSSFTKEDTFYQNSLRYTKKGEIYNSLEIKASIFATYLNPLGENKTKQNEYVVSIFIDDDFDDAKKYGLNNPNITLTQNGVKPTFKKELNEDSKYIKLVPFRNQWSHYYLVRFPKVKNPKLILSDYRYGKCILNFKE